MSDPTSKLPPSALAERLRSLAGGTILITGVTGLVGQSLVKRLHELEVEHQIEFNVVGTSLSGTLPIGLVDWSRITVYAGDLADEAVRASLPAVDYVVHGATYGQPSRFMADQLGTLRLNSIVTEALMRKCRRRFLFVSSSEVYSGIPNERFLESQIGTSGLDHPRAAYIEGKRFGEMLCLHPPNHLESANVARLSLAYGPGPRLDDRRVLNELIVRGIRNQVVDLRGGASSLRSYLFASDAADYLLTILAAGTGTIYNVGGHEAVALGELAERIASILEVPCANVLETQQGGIGAPAEVRLNMDRVDSLLGNLETVDLDAGLRATVRWFERQLSSQS